MVKLYIPFVERERITRRRFLANATIGVVGVATTYWSWGEAFKPADNPTQARIDEINKEQLELGKKAHESGDVVDRLLGVEVLNPNSPDVKQAQLLEKEKNLLYRQLPDSQNEFLGTKVASWKSVSFLMGPLMTVLGIGNILPSSKQKNS